MSDLRVQAVAIVRDLHRLADDQPNTRMGTRWAIEMARAAATLEQVYGLNAELLIQDSALHGTAFVDIDGRRVDPTKVNRMGRKP